MNIRAKFRCTSKTEWSGKVVEVALHPVTTGSEENKTWAKYTPSGEIKMHINNPAAVEAFVVDGEYYVDFTPADHLPL
jgi:hypothetical protein